MNGFIYTILDWLADLGYVGIALGLMIEIIPSEIVLAYGGFLILLGKIKFLGAVIAGTIGGVMAQLFLYWAGYYGGRPFLEKYGRYVFIHKRHLDLAEEWMRTYGPGVVFGGRFIPIVRHAISIPAGITKMPFIQFVTLTTLAIIPWSIFFLYLGITLGSHWNQIEVVAGPFLLPLSITAGICMLIYVAVRRYKKRKM